MFIYKIVIYSGLILGITFLISSVVVFIKLHIMDIIVEALGLSSKKKIRKIHLRTDKNSNIHFSPQMHQINNIKDISISEKLNNMNTYSSDLYNSSKLNSDNVNSQTTTLLYDEAETDILDEYNTEDLEANTEALEERDNNEINKKDIYFKVIANKLVINTYEIID